MKNKLHWKSLAIGVVLGAMLCGGSVAIAGMAYLYQGSDLRIY